MGCGEAYKEDRLDSTTPAVSAVATVGLTATAMMATAVVPGPATAVVSPTPPAVSATSRAVPPATVVSPMVMVVVVMVSSASPVRHVQFVLALLGATSKLVDRSALLELPILHLPFQSAREHPLVHAVKLRSVLGFQVLPNLRHAHPLLLFHVEHGITD